MIIRNYEYEILTKHFSTRLLNEQFSGYVFGRGIFEDIGYFHTRD
jgi:hypothetical protein